MLGIRDSVEDLAASFKKMAVLHTAKPEGPEPVQNAAPIRQPPAVISLPPATLTDAEQMRKALAAVASVSGTQNRFSLTFQADVLQLMLESELGISTVPLSVTALSGQPEGVFWYTLDTLRECLRALDGTLTLDVAQQGVLLLTTDELVCMQTAVRQPKPIEVPNKKQRKNAA